MGFLDDLFGGGETKSTSFTDNRNPYIMDAIGRASTLNRSGLGEDVLSKMRRRVRLFGDRQRSATRGSTAQRLRKGGATRQESEQILADLSSKQLGEVEQALLGVDEQDTMARLKGLEMFGGFSKGLTSKTTTRTQQPGGFGLGQLLGIAGNLIAPGIGGLFGPGKTSSKGGTSPVGFTLDNTFRR